MYKILKARQLADKIYLMDVEAPTGGQALRAGTVCHCKDG